MRGTGRMDFGKQHTLLYSGSENSSHHGVGIIMKNELLPRLQWYRCVSDRVASCLLRQPCRNGSNTDILVISCYAPTIDSREQGWATQSAPPVLLYYFILCLPVVHPG